MVCSMASPNVLFLSCKRFKTHYRLRDKYYMSRALMRLYWLPVGMRIEYKLLLFTYKALHGLAPGYLCELVVPYVPRRVLRSAESNLLMVPPRIQEFCYSVR